MSISILPLRIRSLGFPLLLATLGLASAPLPGQAVQETTPKPPPFAEAPQETLVHGQDQASQRR